MYCGIDIGGTKIAIVISDEDFNILDKIKFKTDIDEDPYEIMDKMSEEIINIMGKLKLNLSELKSIGISCGGPLDSKEGIILSPPNLPKWDRIPIKKYFIDKFDIPTFILNDANACAVAEWKLGAGKGYENIIFLTFGTGMGAGLILDNRLYEGIDGQAGEVGHIRIDREGPIGYGKAGSFEGYCSGSGIKNLALLELNRKEIQGVENTQLLKFAQEDIDTRLIFQLAEEDDLFCKEIIKISARKLGLGLSILIDILNPELTIIGSIYSRGRKYFDEIIKEVIQEEALEINRKTCQIVPSALGENIGDYAALITALGNY